MEETADRLAKLEKSDKEKMELIAKLNRDVGEIKQEQNTVNTTWSLSQA
jgi:hypothetical protein